MAVTTGAASLAEMGLTESQGMIQQGVFVGVFVSSILDGEKGPHR